MNRLGAIPASRWMPLAAFGAAVLLHVDRAPLWSLGVALCGAGWQLLYLLNRLALPGAALRLLITVALLMATVGTFRGVTGLSAGGALLLVMGSAKLLEMRQPRDARVVVVVSLALLMAAVLERQNLSRLPLFMASAWLALAALAASGEHRAGQSPRLALRRSGRALALSLPLAVICFLLAPRLPGALWSLPPEDSATTGLGEEMSPGSITELSTSDEIAFTVRFEGTAPPLSQRYWRGPVLHDFDGHTWRRGRQLARPPQSEPQSAPVHHRVLQQPTGRNFLFGLDSIATLKRPRTLQLFDGQFISTRAVTSVIDYEVVSHLQVRSTNLSALGRRIDTQLPEGRNPRSLALARSLRDGSADDADFTRRVLQHFSEAGLRYTLSPPLLGADSVDELLFETRLGFCGHFASAYVMLMRAAGIPARVVTGYLGGTWNPVGEFHAVRQSDAHAWAEVWLEGQGWVRVDPTSVVAPQRLQRSLGEVLGASASFSDRLLLRAPWLRSLRDSWDAAGNWWQSRVVNFNLAAQLSLLGRIGLPDIDYRALALALLGCSLVWGIWVSRGLQRPEGAVVTHPAARSWESYCRLLRHRGVPVAPHDAPGSVARRATLLHPAAATEIAGFSDLYLKLRFGRDAVVSAADLRELQRRLRALARATAAARPARTA